MQTAEPAPPTYPSTPSQSTRVSLTPDTDSEKTEHGDGAHPWLSRRYASFQASVAYRWPHLHRSVQRIVLYIRGPRPKKDLPSEPNPISLSLPHYLHPRCRCIPRPYVYLPRSHAHHRTRAHDSAAHSSIHCTLAIRPTRCRLYRRLHVPYPCSVVPHTRFLSYRMHICFLDGGCWLRSQRRTMCTFYKRVLRVPVSRSMSFCRAPKPSSRWRRRT